MNKYKYLLKNVGLLTVSNFGTKILSFILIPLYTSILSAADYGTYDMYFNTISLAIPILTLNIVEAIMRFTLEKEKNKAQVFTIGFKKVVQAILIFTLLDVFNSIFNFIPLLSKYSVFLLLLFVGSVLYDLMSQLSRGVERVTDLAIAGALNSVVMLSLNVIFLIEFNMGLMGYFAANCIAYYIPVIYLCIRLRVWKYFEWKIKNINLKKEMFAYSKPLVFNNIAWWINNVSDRYVVTWMCGIAANGIYSVAYKIPSILNIFQSIFSQAWTLSAVKEFDGNNELFYSQIYKIYNSSMVIICSGLILSDKIIAKILFAKDFYIAWQYAPFLMISTVFGSMSGMLGGIFSAAKQSKIIAKTTIIGASVNTILNIFLVYLWGPVGAAIATLISYSLVWGARLRAVNKIIKLDINIKKDICAYIILITQSIIWLCNFRIVMSYMVQIFLVIAVIAIYLKEEKMLILNMLDKFKKNKLKKEI